MPDLAPTTAFGRTDARRRRFGAVVLSENITLGLASLAVPRDAAPPWLKGLQLPGPGTWVGGAETSAFWIAPNQWMIEVPDGADADLEGDLRTAVPNAAVTGQTDGWTVLEMASDAGPRPLECILEKLVNLDLDRLKPGSATRTGLEHMSVFVIRRSPTTLAVLGMRSAAGSLWHALDVAVSRVAEGWA